MTFSRSWVQRWRLQTTFPTNALLRWRRTDSTVCRRRVVVTINVSKQWLLARWQDFSPLQLTSAAAHFLSQECTRMQYISLQIKKFRRSRPLDRLDFRAGGKILPHLYPCALCPVPRAGAPPLLLRPFADGAIFCSGSDNGTVPQWEK